MQVASVLTSGGGGVQSSAAAAASSSSSACTLRIVLINDVYELDQFPKFASARRLEAVTAVHSTGQSRPDKCIAVIAGDFLAPSMLSSIDKGFGMVDCLNKCGIDYCCIGNHEGDHDFRQFILRVKESKFKWINSNIPDLANQTSFQFSEVLRRDNMPEYVVIEIESDDKTNKRRVALIGLCCEDPAVLMPGAFNKCLIEPVNVKAAELYKKIMQIEKVDAIIPLTHQLMYQDRELAEENVGFPIILGGHDHDPYLECVSNCTIIKSGSDARNFGSCDIVWRFADSPSIPEVDAKFKKTSDFLTDAELALSVKSHRCIIDELCNTTLDTLPLSSIDDPKLLSSIGMRLRPTTMGAFVCNMIMLELNTECALVGGGCIRANRHYHGETRFTYAHLKAELPFDTKIVKLHLPGRVICDMITYTRSFALQSPPIEKGAYFQTDSKIVWSESENRVTHINESLVKMDQIYSCALNYNTLVGMDDVLPLLNYKASCPKNDKSGIHKTDESALPVKDIIMGHFGKKLLFDILREQGGFENVDTDQDSKISKSELLAAIKKSTKYNAEASYVLVDNIFNIADLNNHGCISKEDISLLQRSGQHMAGLTRISSFTALQAREPSDENNMKASGGGSGSCGGGGGAGVKDLLSVGHHIFPSGSGSGSRSNSSSFSSENSDVRISVVVEAAMELGPESLSEVLHKRVGKVIDRNGDGIITTEEDVPITDTHKRRKVDI